MFDRLVELLSEAGYLGIALLMFLENIFPPIPSELIMPSAGYSAGQGQLSLPGVIAAGTFGSVAGALFWYYVGQRVGTERLKSFAARHGRWLTLKPADIEKADHWFDAHSGMAVVLGRLIPAIRTLISIPAGIFGMKLPKFLLYSTLGTALWTTLLATAGYLLQNQHEQVSAWLNPITTTIMVLMALFYLYRVTTWRPGS